MRATWTGAMLYAAWQDEDSDALSGNLRNRDCLLLKMD